MTKSRLLVDYEIVEMSGTKLAIFKNGGEDVYVVNKETAYILNLLKKGFRNVEIVSEMNSHMLMLRALSETEANGMCLWPKSAISA